jgi:YVTN family beta-propeller protein
MLRALVTASIVVFASGLQPTLAAELAVVCKEAQKVAFYNPDTGELLGSAATGQGAQNIEVSPDYRRAWVSDFMSPKNTISIIDVRKHELIDRVEIQKVYGPRSMVITRDGKSLYVTFERSRVVGRLDPNTGKVLATIPMGMKGTRYLTLSKDESRLFAANVVSDNISVIDLERGQVDRHMIAGDFPEGMALSPDGKTLWVGSQGSNDIRVLDVTADPVIVATIPAHGAAARLAFTPDGKRVVVTCPANNLIFVFDAESHEVVESIHTNPDPYVIAMPPDGKVAYISIAGANAIAVLDLESLELTRTFDTLAMPTGLAYIE